MGHGIMALGGSAKIIALPSVFLDIYNNALQIHGRFHPKNRVFCEEISVSKPTPCTVAGPHGQLASMEIAPPLVLLLLCF